MIRHTLQGPPARRIAVVRIPRTERNRLGGVRNATPFVSMVTLSDQLPSTADQWYGDIATQQALVRGATPGNVSYNPSNVVAPDPIVPNWNSWAGPCAAADVNDDTAKKPATDSVNPFWYITAGLTAAAATIYLLNNVRGRKG